MSEKGNDALQTYLKAKRSGNYQHPRSKEIFDEGPAHGGGEIPNDAVKPETKERLPVRSALLALVLMTLAGGTGYLAIQPDPIQKVDEISESVGFGGADDEIHIIDEVDGEPIEESIGLDRPIVIPQEPKVIVKKVYVKVPSYTKEQEIALERIKAWERVSREAIKRYYDTPVEKGRKRTLCLALDGETQCESRLEGIE